MKNILLFTFLYLLGTIRINVAYAQTAEEIPTRLFRLSEDNDFINIRGKGTDRAYTNGTRIDLFYTKKIKSRFIIDRVMPKAGDSSVNVYGWGLAQLMFTPSDITTTLYQPNDYPYAGALYATHSLYSYNMQRKYSFQTELLFGVRGPSAFSKQTQTFIHRLIGYKKPMGWDNQLKNKLLVNVNVTSEKQLLAYHNWFEIIGGGHVFAGSMLNGARIYPLIRIGKFTPYFNGFISQHTATKAAGTKRTNRLQAYLVVRPTAMLILSNTLLSGEVNGSTPKTMVKTENTKKAVLSFNFGAVLAIDKFSLSFNQSSTTAILEDVYAQEVGNITLCYSW